METKKQTAVDMFCTTITDHIEAIFNGSIQQDEFAKRMRQSYNQAKEMEMDQIMMASAHSHFEGGNYKISGLELFEYSFKYYTSTYGK
jgi:hypothetical protein